MAGLSAGGTAWKMAFQISPIILVGGLAPSFLGGYLPIIAITEVINFPASLLSGMEIGTDHFFANFRPVPGSTLVENEFGHYPFANQSVAANAVVAQPKQIILEMICPAATRLGYFEKLAVMEALVGALDIHWQMGGRFIVMTPSKIYPNCLLKAIRDTSQGTTNQPQASWQWEFEQPLLAASDLGGLLNSLYDWISRGTEMPGAPVSSGIAITSSTTESLATGQGMTAATAGTAQIAQPIGVPASSVGAGVTAPSAETGYM